MRSVTIIANPASGRDIRRLVAHGSVVHSSEKVNIIRRVLLGMESAGVEEVLIMPDYHGLCSRAVDGLKLGLKTRLLDMTPENTQNDSTRAAEIASEMGTACIIVLGGDGTNRVVAKSSGETPLLPIATGTNNVFSNMIEGTLAGIAAGYLASISENWKAFTSREPRLEIWQDAKPVDIALIDLVVSHQRFVASRAIWEVDDLSEVFLTRGEPENIGFSSLGGFLYHLPQGSGQALYLTIGPGKQTVKAPIAPGLVKKIPVKSLRVFNPGEEIAVNTNPGVIALDGEREFQLNEGESVTIKLNLEGPRVVKLSDTLQQASGAVP